MPSLRFKGLSSLRRDLREESDRRICTVNDPGSPIVSLDRTHLQIPTERFDLPIVVDLVSVQVQPRMDPA